MRPKILGGFVKVDLGYLSGRINQVHSNCESPIRMCFYRATETRNLFFAFRDMESGSVICER